MHESYVICFKYFHTGIDSWKERWVTFPHTK